MYRQRNGGLSGRNFFCGFPERLDQNKQIQRGGSLFIENVHSDGSFYALFSLHCTSLKKCFKIEETKSFEGLARHFFCYFFVRKSHLYRMRVYSLLSQGKIFFLSNLKKNQIKKNKYAKINLAKAYTHTTNKNNT